MKIHKCQCILSMVLLMAWACFAFYMEDHFYLLQAIEDGVGAGNYTHFKLTRNGNVRIVLQSLEGDADIYVSESNPKPTFEDYDIKSVTCGYDYVDIPDTFHRPTAIAIYGHPSYEHSIFKCSVYLDTRDLSRSDFTQIPSPDSDVESEHPAWIILIKLLEFILDVAL